MSKPTKSSLFIVSPLAKHGGFYQQLLRCTGSYEQLGNLLIQLGEQAHAVRQFDKVKEFGLLLSNSPLKRYQAIGYYFLAVAANNMGNGDQDEARRLFELVVDTAPDTYKVKAILSLGALARHKKSVNSAMRFYQETIKNKRLSLSTFQAMRGIATLKSDENYHRLALSDLERILPVIKFLPAHIYLDCLNSYAVELSAVGRLEEATNVSSLVAASPLALRYPEWLETLSEIRSKQKRRFIVTFSLRETEETELTPLEPVGNVIEFPVEQTAAEPRVQIAINFMSVHLQRQVSVSELSAVVNLSTNYFSYLFKTETGVSPGEYLIRLRMEKASHLLATTLLRIKEVMALVGYNNKGNFSRHFKKHLGLTPSAYRKEAFSRSLPLKFRGPS